MNQLTIVSVFHKEYSYNKYCLWIKPISVGNFFGDNDFLHDNTGDNISHFNYTYAELTGLYWAWKNLSSDYLGLCHYRRYFNFARSRNMDINSLSSEIQKEAAIEILRNYDVILPYGISLGNGMEAQYKGCHVPHHYDVLMDEVKKLYPNRDEDLRRINENSFFRHSHCFVARKEVFNHYCSELFSVLETVRSKIDVNIDKPDKRHMGYLGERFLNIFFQLNGYKIWGSEVVIL